ncbi:hypothetical protein [Salinarimonas ramus]|uniref:Uncharacterized protein n=1 Tax=Salinarimonas ramus TaxID=690164 RepID=A0A917Q651_9HYPH|nr:hypothetical protein [Salinarimonas ramus]GGK29298.1 hypothetical protein GCM10011322_14620 [Salinarimonas ramus]
MLNLRLTDFFVVEREFATPDEIKRHVAQAKESRGPLHALLFFSTEKQQSWFVAAGGALHLVVDHTNEASPKILWTIPLDELGSVEIGERSRTTGLITVGGKRPRFFSKKLFADEPIDVRLRDMIERARQRTPYAA